MHGLIHTELAGFVTKNHGADTWQQLLVDADLPGKVYDVLEIYDDAEIAAIVAAAATALGVDADVILLSFGEYLAPQLVKLHQELIDPAWKTMDLLLNVEETVHQVVRIEDEGAAPPVLTFTQVGSDELELYYNSPRNMVAVARGIMAGFASYFGETIEMNQSPHADGGTVVRVQFGSH
ncbi:MAG: heme NO-binding domain-containing protein [Acidimicrobiales bacterium]